MQAPDFQELMAQQLHAIERAAAFTQMMTEQLRRGEAIFTRGPAAGQLVLRALDHEDPRGGTVTLDTSRPAKLDPAVCDLSASSDLAKPLLAKDLAEPLLAKPTEPESEELDDDRSELGSTFSWTRQASPDSRYALTVSAKHRLGGLREEQEMQHRLKSLTSGNEASEASVFKSDGCCQAVAQNRYFQAVTLVMVLLNLVWIGIDIDFNTALVLCDAPPLVQVVDNCFCLYFVFEVLVRVLALRRKCSALRSPWFLFDLVLAGSMAWETWLQVIFYLWLGWAPTGPGGATNSLRVLRIFRITRMARLVRLLPELRILVKGMAAGLRSIAAILILLLLMIYIFALTFRQLGTFESVPTAMQFLLTQVLCGYDADFFGKMLEDGWVCYITFLMFMLFASFTLLNMLIGILCSVVSSVTEQAEEDRWHEELEAKVDHMKVAMDLHKTGRFSVVELEHMLQNPGEYLGLHELGVDIMTLLRYLRLYVTEAGDISWDDFKHVLGRCNVGSAVTLKEFVEYRQYLSTELSIITSHVDKIFDKIDKL